MKLKSFGCSFIYGTDLADDGKGFFYSSPSKLTWPSLLAKKHNWDYTCYARPGSGNLQIAEAVLNQLTDSEPAIYVIGWTWIDRFDYTTTDARRSWRTIMPVDTDSLAKTYYCDLHSEYRDKLVTLMNVKLCIDALIASGNRFVMTYMDNLMFDQQWNTSPAVSLLQGQCQSHMTTFNNKSFLEYSKEKGFEISPTLHPLEAAHQSAFELIDSYNLV
jgi:hypothetical protein